MYAYLEGSDRSNAAAFSLIVSIFTTAFTSAGTSFDKDLSKSSRECQPHMYGYIPEGGKEKIRVFFLLFVMASIQLFTKAFACSLCAMSGTRLLIGFLVGEQLLYMLYRLLRRDFLYWLPIYGPAGVFFALLVRTVEKMILDFTALVHLRHPYQMGGAYWMFSLCLTPISCFYFASRYLDSNEVSDGDAGADVDAASGDAGVDGAQSVKLSAGHVYGLIGGLCALQLFTFSVLLRSMKKGYRRTFFSFKTAAQHCRDIFYLHTEDRLKFSVLEDSRYKWKPIEDELKEWLKERLPIWLNSQVEWFDAHRKAMIPDDMITDSALLNAIRDEEVVAIVEKRRASLAPSLDVAGSSAPDLDDPVMRRRKSLVQEARESLREN